jgi:hypothetical protein
MEQALLIAQEHGVQVPTYIRFFLVDEGDLPADAHAAYLSWFLQEGNRLFQWDDCLNDFGQVPVRVRASVLESDEAIVAVFAHEVHEITRLRALFEANNGVLRAGEIYNLISPEVANNLHDEAVDVGDQLVRAMRGQ